MQSAQDLGQFAEEIANSVTHGVGLGLSLAGFAVLAVIVVDHGDTWSIASCGIYGSTLVGLYAASTLYHSFPETRWKEILRIVDHAAIYLLIAGTYTPFELCRPDDGSSWLRLGTVWGVAITGVGLKIFWTGRYNRFSTLFYVVMGWAILGAMEPILRRIPLAATLWLLAGGVLYTAGVWFYARDHLRYHHAIWHLFVLGGSICHYFAVLSSIVALSRP